MDAGRNPLSPLARQFTQPAAQPPAAAPDAYEAIPTQHRDAAKVKSRAHRFRLVMADGRRYGFQMAHIVSWMLESGELSLYMTTHKITLSGQNLEALELLLPEDKLTEVREFRPGIDGEPAANAPKVTRISIEPYFKNG